MTWSDILAADPAAAAQKLLKGKPITGAESKALKIVLALRAALVSSE